MTFERKLQLALIAGFALCLVLALGVYFARQPSSSAAAPIAPRPIAPPIATNDPWANPPPPPAAVHDVQRDDAKEKLRTDIVTGLARLMKSMDCDCTVTVEDEALVVVTPGGHCDKQALRDLQKSLVAFDLDPAKAFRSMRCSDDPAVLTFR